MDINPRYCRQMLLPTLGPAGQERLSHSRVLIIGIGALGSVIADLLARAGVGRLRLVDRDLVELSNLHRQTLYNESDAENALPKAVAASNRLASVNSSIAIEPVVADVHSGNLPVVADFSGAKPHLILDGSDNAPLRYLVNDYAVANQIPWIYGAAVALEGRAMPILPSGPCLRCVYPNPPAPGELATCDTAGVLGAASSLVASWQAALAISILTDQKISPNLLSIDLLNFRTRTLDLTDAKNPDCPCCSKRQFEFLNVPAPAETTLCGKKAVQILPNGKVDYPALLQKLQSAGALTQNRFYAVCCLNDPKEITLTLFPDGRLIVNGTPDPNRAKSIASRFLGY